MLAPVLGPYQKKLAMSPCSTVHSGQHDTKYMRFELLMNATFVADEIWCFTLEPARIYTKYFFTRYSIPVWTKKIGAASTAVTSLSNIMHIFLKMKVDLRPVPANIICRRPYSLLTQHLQAYRGSKGGHAFVHHPSDGNTIISVNNQIVIIQSTFTFLI